MHSLKDFIILAAFLLLGMVAGFGLGPDVATVSEVKNQCQAHIVDLMKDRSRLRHSLVDSERLHQLALKHDVPDSLAHIVWEEARKEGIAPELVFAVIEVESNFDSRAISSIGAIGLMQVRFTTARSVQEDITRKKLFNPRTNVRIGIKYLKRLIKRYDGDIRHASYAYNLGPTRYSRLVARGQSPPNKYGDEVLRLR